jgi:hypothetical protein
VSREAKCFKCAASPGSLLHSYLMESLAGPSSQPRRPPPVFRSTSTFSRRNSAHSSIFLSKLPADPFSSSAFLQRDPIVLNSERLYHASFNSQPARDVILVLGGQYPLCAFSLNFSTDSQIQVLRTSPLYSTRSALHSPFSSWRLIGLQPYPQRYSLRFAFSV